MATKSQSHKTKTPAAKDNPSIKNAEVYEALREQGASKEKAARIANAKAKYGDAGPKSPSVRGGKAAPYEDWTRDALYERAKEIGVAGLSRATKGELIHALRSH
ncbi:hypothetical protein GCM10008171_15420 [Methylopila jiangsuensis]|uniref:Rho termination factor n=1 Tax=Methylopila jiangsuensis TaxID=586230 RepID=A0A9W6N3H0_9HYPH|nr:Rho termination factor [Methylopila jiangsuensis]MDR6284194.1 hypothetical protein [Methylopila jiangsuensis]GLK76288.1 hypothetical protein GCM10008171_15420 [Methylopila jiangsuensis]